MAINNRPQSEEVGDSDLFLQIFNQSPAIEYLLNPNTGSIVDANDAACAFWGWSRDQLRTMRIWDINVAGKQKIEEQFSETSAGLTFNFQCQHRIASGDLRDVEVYVNPIMVRGELLNLIIAHDVTDRHRAEEALSLARRALESVPVGIIIADAQRPDMPITYMNPAFEALTGYPPGEVLGRNCRFLQGLDRDQPEIQQIRTALQQGRGCEVILRNYKKDGTMFWNQLHIAPVRNDVGVITHFVGAQKDISQQVAANARIAQLAFYDPLTELPNRRLFLDRLANCVSVAQRNNTFGAVVFIDLDNFKNLNDAEGHEIGDDLLKQIARRLREAVREEDTVSRLGGDEFVLLLPALSDNSEISAHMVQAAIARIQKVIDEPLMLGKLQHHIAASIGVTLFPKGVESASDLLKQADTAMYRAKAAGRNGVCYFEPTMQAAVSARLTMEHDLREAMERQDFRMFLQGQVDATGKIVGAEGLIRWHNKEGGLISPMAFIPVAEDTGLIVPMGKWMLKQACLAIKKLEDAGRAIRISVNVSPRQFRAADFRDQVAEVLRETGANGNLLMLEITEAVVFDNLNEAISKMRQLKELGVHFSIDDFGTGYSSLAYLKKLPLTELKIDKSFIQDAPTDMNDASLVEAILAVASHHGLQVVAEGVETLRHVEFLKERGCPLFQGYHFFRPMPGDEFINNLIKG
jgi:diguanylate cyclase (GGDEF)-like protein/PAS domain S-box-containing protein